MQNNYRSKKFKAWLDTLQQESWQLELLISGFAIYGLFQAIAPLELNYQISQNSDKTLIAAIYSLGLTSSYILIFTLLLHIILRGLWIGALGLRYVSGDIDFKNLNYTPKFDKYLRKRIVSFDRYIARLEDYCSIIFALSFLLVFYVLSLFLLVGCISAFTFIFLVQDGEKNMTMMTIGGILILLFLVGMIVVFIDFLTQGYLKKKKWLAFFYFPVYWVFSFLTLSFLYRPLVYNFLDNRFGRTISIILVPIYFLIIFLSSTRFTRSNYLLLKKDSNTHYANIQNYNTSLETEGVFIDNASIPSRVITTNYLPIFIEYNDDIENKVFDFNPDLKPDKDQRGFGSEISFSNEQRLMGKNDSLLNIYMQTIKDLFIVKIDSLTINSIDYIYTQNLREQEGFETVLPLDSINNGKHLLRIYRKNKKESNENGTFEAGEVAMIPFWFYKKD